jgi:hypothetical protein
VAYRERIHARFGEMLSKPMLIRYFDEIPFAAESSTGVVE